MSKNFISFRYNIEGEPESPEDIENIKLWGLSSVDGKNSANPPGKNNLRRGLLLPEFDENDYTKSMVECTVNLLTVLSYSLSMSGQGNKDNITPNDIPLELAVLIRRVSGTLQWIVNCDSWRNEKLKDYDVMEINQKLKASI